MAEHHVQNQKFIKSLDEVIQVNIGNENFGPKELATAVGMRQRKLSIRLRSITNKSVCQFICEARLNKALAMLQNEDVTASEVAYKIGFGSATYFNKCFHEYFGFPPGKIRKEAFDNHDESIPVRKISDYLSLKSFWRTVIKSFGGLLAIALLAFIITYTFSKNSTGNNSTIGSRVREKSIAVLPFINMGDSTDTWYFVDGLMDEILTDLSRIADLRVLSRISVEQFRGKKETASEIARILNVEYLVTGSGQKYDSSYQLRVQLSDARNNRQLWAESYNREIKETKDIYEIQSQIAQSIAEELKATIKPGERQLIKKIPTKNLTAYYYYLKGSSELSQSWYPDYKPEHLERAAAFFRNALENDSTFVQAYTGLASIYWQKYARDNTIKDDNIFINYLDSTLILADIALSYDPDMAYSYCIRASYYAIKGNLGKALEENDKAVRCSPNDWFATYQKGYLYMNIDIVKALEFFHKAACLVQGPELKQSLVVIGEIYCQTGFPEIGNQYFLEAFNLDKDSVQYLCYLAECEANHGDLEKSIKHREKQSLTDLSNAAVLANLGVCYLFKGQVERALKYFEKYLSGTRESDLVSQSLYAYIGYAYQENGNPREANFYFKRIIEISKNRIKLSLPVDHYSLAGVFAVIGEKDKAYDNLNVFSQKKYITTADLFCLKSDPLFRSIRNESRFQKIVGIAESKYKMVHKEVNQLLEGLNN